MIIAALFALADIPGQISDANAAPAPRAPTHVADDGHEQRGLKSRFFARVGVAGALYNSGAKISAGGSVIPDATVHIKDDVTAILDLGYNITDNVAVQVMVGIPPRAAAIGRGTVAPFGELGAVRLAPVIATAVYRLPAFHGFCPYVGAGGTYVFILKSDDGAVTNLDVEGNWGAVVQAGVEYRLSRRVELFADYKRLWVKVRAKGNLGPAPVRARVTLDPDVVSAGVRFNFR
jgi:outer membrane protein